MGSGASLLSETWPKKWRPWIAATLQTAVNFGILLACFSAGLLEGGEPPLDLSGGHFPCIDHAMDSQSRAGN